MGNFYLLLEGQKGLYHTNGAKMFFPDRKWTDAKAGFFTDLHETVQKDTYSFITGKMLETLPLTADVFFETQPFKLTSTYFSLQIGDAEAIVEKDCHANWTVFVNTKEGVQSVYFVDDFIQGVYRMERTHYHRNCFTAELFKNKKLLDTTAQQKAWYFEFCQLDDDKIMTACVRIRSMVEMLYRTYYDFKIYDNTFIVVKSQYKYESSVAPSEYTFVFDGKNIIELSAVNVKSLGKLTKVINNDELEKFIVDNHICLGFGDRSIEYHDIVYTTLKALGVELTLYAWCGGDFTMDKLQDAEKVAFIEKSYEELKATTKRVGRYCSGGLINDLQKLNPRPWLLHNSL